MNDEPKLPLFKGGACSSKCPYYSRIYVQWCVLFNEELHYDDNGGTDRCDECIESERAAQ